MTASIKNKIRIIRELKNYTQEYVAEQLGITQANYSKIEKGKTSLTYAKLEEIANILEVSVEDIITFDSQRSFSSFNPLNGKKNEAIIMNCENHNDLKNLYEDKIALLEKLLCRTEQELERYKSIFGPL